MESGMERVLIDASVKERLLAGAVFEGNAGGRKTQQTHTGLQSPGRVRKASRRGKNHRKKKKIHRLRLVPAAKRGGRRQSNSPNDKYRAVLPLGIGARQAPRVCSLAPTGCPETSRTSRCHVSTVSTPRPLTAPIALYRMPYPYFSGHVDAASSTNTRCDCALSSLGNPDHADALTAGDRAEGDGDTRAWRVNSALR